MTSSPLLGTKQLSDLGPVTHYQPYEGGNGKHINENLAKKTAASSPEIDSDLKTKKMK